MSLRSRVQKLLVAIVLLSIFPAVRLAESNFHDDGPTVCFFRTWTGYSCPFCGLTRSLAAAMHGNWSRAWHLHPLWWLPPILIILAAAMATWDAVAGTNVTRFWKTTITKTPYHWLAAILLGLWLLRLLG